MNIKTMTKALSACLLFSLAVTVQAESGPVFEMRTYTTHEGKLPELHERFTNHTIGLFEKHGIRNVGYWIPTDPDKADNTLIFILKYSSADAAEENWQAFVNDPEWQKAYAESHEDGPLVKDVESVHMTATEYSAIK